MARMNSLRFLPARPPAALIAPIVRLLVLLHVTPTMLTVAGVVGNVAAGVLIWMDHLTLAGAVTLIFSGLDMLDGALARATGRATREGALLDSVLDRISEAAVIGGMAVWAFEHQSREMVILAVISLAGSLMVSYVRARAEGLGVALTDGLFTRAERVVLVGVALLFGWMRLALWILAILTSLTALQRLYIARRRLRQEPPA